ncbi:MAG: hypothetical protein JNK85_14070, partial [Verrucomicrobiales bacterium]|nr:hypothetical protein [Verrucomicrobiales bacterium]
RLRVRNGLTLDTGKVRLDSNGIIGFEGSQTFAGEIHFEGAFSYLSIDGTSTLTLAPTALVHGANGRIGQAIFLGGLGTLVNQGTIRADVAGSTLVINPNVFSNLATLETRNGGTLSIESAAWTQGGQLRVGPGTLNLGGALSPGSIGTVVADGGSAVLSGNLDLQGGTLALNNATGPLQIDGATVKNGSITQSGAGQLVFSTHGQNFLDTIRLTGDLVLTNNGARVRIRNGLTLDTGKVRLHSNGIIGFDGTQTFTGEIHFEGAFSYLSIEGTSTLTLAPTALVHGANGRIGQAIFLGGIGTLVNQGTIRADVAGSTLVINANVFSNVATLETRNGGTLSIESATWTQGGQLRVGPGIINLGGTLSPGSIGTLVAEGGSTVLSGNLDLQGGTLALNNATGPLQINGATLKDGSITQSGAGQLIFTTHSQNFLDAIRLTGDLVLTNNSARVRIRNGLTLDTGKVRLDSNGILGFDGTQTFAGEIQFEGAFSYLSIEGTSTLTLAPTALVHGSNGRIGQAVFLGGIGTLVNQGTIRAEVAGAMLVINPNSFSNAATLETRNGGILSIESATWTQGGQLRAGPGTINLGGTLAAGSIGTLVADGGSTVLSGNLDLQGGTLALNNSTGPLQINGATVENGSITQSGAGQLVFSTHSQNFLDAIRLVGDLVLTNNSARVRIRNGLTLDTGKVRLNSNGILGFDGTQTFAGEVHFEGALSYLSIEGTSTLTLAPTALVHGANGRIGQAIFLGGTATLVNQGTIRAEVAGATLLVNPNVFSNAGTLQQVNGGTLVAPGFP